MDTEDRTINVLQVGYLGTDEVVVTANESGDVCVWFTMNLQRDPLLLSVTDSAWGIAIHAEKRLIAVSSNAHTVTVFHCGIDGKLSRRRLSGDSKTVVDTHQRISAPASTSPATTGSVEGTSQQILRGHGHNIPTVTFSSCGNFVATASVDRTCRTWRLSDGNQIQEKTLGPLWGWGVCFISKESWITLSLQQYKQIPKHHLRPGKLPGQNVKDSPFSTTAFTQRTLPMGRDLRMIRSRWYAGPLHDMSCDDLDSDEDEEDLFRQGSRAARQNRSILRGDTGVYQDGTDTQNVSLFGVDIDQIEYEWGNLSSSSSIADEMQYHDDEPEQVTSTYRHPVTSAITLDVEDSNGIEVDGNNEEIDMGTETVGRRAEEGTSLDPAPCYNNEGNRSVAGHAVATVSEAPGREGSSSDQKHHDGLLIPAKQYPASKAIGSTGIADQEQRPQEVINVMSSHIGISIHTEPHVPPPPPHYPMELLACATARNIYLLSRYPSAPDAAKDGITDPSATAPQGSISLPPRFYQTSGDEDDEDEFDSSNAIHEGSLLAWPDGGDEEMVDSEYDPDYDTDPYYEDIDDLMSTADEDEDENEDEDEEDMGDDGSGVDDGGEDDEDHEGDSDEDTDDPSTQNRLRPWRFHVSSQGPAVPSLHTLSVARAAASRADGRRVHYLDHFDRLFVMLLVPELSVLIAASQKGTVTIFRLLSVPDDSTTHATKTHGSLDAVGPQFAGREVLKAVEVQIGQNHQHEESRTAAANRNRVYKNDDESTATIMVQGVKHVLFPEVYLPRLEPPPSPLVGVSVLPLLRRPSGPSSASSVGSFLLHLVYVDSQLYSYEIVLGNVEEDDLVDVSNVFV
ncbi:hypothetical protein BGZ51_000972 [Haplosporangium sp. Z 767]|nr:hypothetical protein BGZ51_000972 [Haplosporangium sp. Z 767]KAF9189728.1 hypothetical protein BGZ50_000597 [Haplosporangium sp. Z 11]